MIQVQGDRDGLAQRFGHGHGPRGQVRQHGGLGVFAGTAGNLQDHRRLGFRTAGGDALKLLHVVEIIGRHGKAFVHGLPEHIAGIDQTEILEVDFMDHGGAPGLKECLPPGMNPYGRRVVTCLPVG